MRLAGRWLFDPVVGRGKGRRRGWDSCNGRENLLCIRPFVGAGGGLRAGVGDAALEGRLALGLDPLGSLPGVSLVRSLLLASGELPRFCKISPSFRSPASLHGP